MGEVDDEARIPSDCETNYMAVVCSDEAVAQLAAILQEAFEEPPGDWYHFTDASPNSGYFGTIGGLEPEAAGRAVAGTSVAQQVSHVAFVMDTATALLREDAGSPSLEQWEASWQTDTSDRLTWQRMQEQLRTAYHRLHDAIQLDAASNAEAFATAVGTIAHVAYHLAAIRQKIAVLEEEAS